MTAHELARKLLDGPDVPVLTLADEEKDLYGRVADPYVWHAWPASGDADPLWHVMAAMQRVTPPAHSIPVIVLFPA
jgi:hypothetical protein